MSYPKGSSQRRYSPVEKENAVRLVRLRREETGESHGSVKAVAEQLGSSFVRVMAASTSCRSRWSRTIWAVPLSIATSRV